MRPVNPVFQVLYKALPFLVVLCPALFVFTFLYGYMGVSLQDYGPSHPSDEVEYYSEILTFARHGFSGGYYVANEDPAPLTVSHFGVHGPLFPMLYGSMGKILSWKLFSGPLYNLFFLSAALALFVYLTRPDRFRLVIILLFFLSFWQMYSYAPSNMQESLHHGIAIVLSGFFYLCLYKKGPYSSKWFLGLFFLLLFFASMIRISWAILLLPYLFLAFRPRTARGCVFTFAAFGAGLALFQALFSFICSPHTIHRHSFLMSKVFTSTTAFGAVLGRLDRNLNALIEPLSANFIHNIPLIYLYIFLTLAFVGAGGALLYRARKAGHKKGLLGESLFHAWNLGAILGATLLLYYVENGGSPRVFSSHLLLSFLLFAVSKKRIFLWAAGLVLAVNLLSGPFCLPDAAEKHRRLGHFSVKPKIMAFQEAVGPYLVYRQGENPWCNTLLTNLYVPELAGVPAGIGVSHFKRPAQLSFPLKSGYILTNQATLEALDVRVEKLPVYLGEKVALYRNLSSDCPP